MEYKLLPRQPYVDNYTVFKDNGDMIHYQNKFIHKDHDFAYYKEDGSKAWYTHGVVQRPDGGPSIIRGNGNKCWMLGDKMYRENGLPHVETAKGVHMWYDESGEMIAKQLPGKEKVFIVKN